MHIKKLSMAVAGVLSIALGTVTVAPAQAALLDFSFTTVTGTTGSFTLDTDTNVSPVPANFGVDPITGIPITGLSYPNAVSNLSIPRLNLSNETADFEVAPSLPTSVLGIPNIPGVLSGVVYPAGCSRGTNFGCSFTLALGYTGDLSILPELSDDPSSYPAGISLDLFNPATAELINRDFITNVQVTRRQAVPESNSGWSMLAFGIGGLSLLQKGNSVKKSIYT